MGGSVKEIVPLTVYSLFVALQVETVAVTEFTVQGSIILQSVEPEPPVCCALISMLFPDSL